MLLMVEVTVRRGYSQPADAVDATPVARPQLRSMYLVAPRRPGAGVAVPRGSRAALARYEVRICGAMLRNSVFRNASHGGQKKISLTLNLEIRSLGRVFLHTSRLIHWGQLYLLS